jgi:type IV pilus assembly protein PilW
MKKLNFPLHQGRSLVEVMIALTLGMVVLLAVSSMFIGNRGTYRSMDEKARLDEEGRLALQLMVQHVRMAGYGSLSGNTRYDADHYVASGGQTTAVTAPAVFTRFNQATAPTPELQGFGANAIRGCRTGFANSQAMVTALACAAGGTSDALMVRYEVDNNSANLTAGNVPTDCIGNAISPTPLLDGTQIFIIDNRFFIQNNPVTGTPELYCNGNGGTVNYPNASLTLPAQPLAENVEQMIISYGLLAPAVDSDGVMLDPDRVFSQSINRYVRADLVTNWNQVGTVKICLVVRSANNGVTTAPQQYRNCNDDLVTPNDRRMRGVYISTIAIRSRIVGVGS